MGEIADSIINGDFDCYTGEYIGRGFGIPRTHNKSLPWEKKDFTQSKDVAFKGLSKYLQQKLGISDITSIVNEYMPDIERSLKQKCLAIQKDFGKFVQWINKNNKRKTIQP
jgi:hypothetical protein